ncbi:MAG: hypothetical protein HYT16_02995 [DPANN group archaeon]|nr:hypothetical protein [DPANN group archaeon]
MKRLVKILLAAVIVAAVVVLAGLYMEFRANTQTQSNSDSLLRFQPDASELKGWQLTWEAKNLAEWPEEQRKSFISKNIEDAAGWRYQRGTETLEIWARDFASEEDVRKIETGITNPLFWKAQSALGFADYAMIGVHVSEKPSPLLIYFAKNRTIFYINYYNKDGVYDASQITKDKALLVLLAKKMLAKY